MRVSKRRTFSYGWVIVAITIICVAVIYGVRHSFAVFFSPVLDEFGWTRGSTAFMLSLNVLLYGLMAPISGSLASRWKPKLVMSIGVVLLGLSTASCALANELWHFYLLFGVLMPLGTVFAGAPVLIPALVNWFPRKRGMALGLGFAGGGLSFSMAMYTEALISIMEWRWAFVALASTVVGIVIPVVLLLFRYRPESPEPTPEGIPEIATVGAKRGREVTAGGGAFGDWSLVQILRNYRLWLLMLSWMLYIGIGQYLVVSHQVVFAEDLGYSSLFAATVLGFSGIFMAMGMVSAFVSDRIGRERTFTLATILFVFSLLILLLQKDASHPFMLYVYALCFGFGLGLAVPTITAGAADLFQGKHFGTVNGLLLMGMGLGAAIGPWLGGYIFDITGSYIIAFIVCIVACCTACITFWVAAPRKANELAGRTAPS